MRWRNCIISQISLPGIERKEDPYDRGDDPALDSLYYAALTQSIEQYAAEAGYSVLFSNSQNGS